MVAFKWNKYFVTGLNGIDSQHKVLVNLVNYLGNLEVENNCNASDFNKIANELIDYTKYHFSEELKLMNLYNISKKHIDEHCKAHDQFVNEVVFMIEGIRTNGVFNISELFFYLMNWLAYHILGMDQEMSTQFELISEGLSPNEAYNTVYHSKSKIAEPLLVALKGLFEQVSEKNSKLVMLNKTLEHKVKNRTKELYNLNRELKVLSYTDPLTGIFNRRFAVEELQKFWDFSTKNNTHLSCVFIDADNFKVINDSYGHDAGDDVLIGISNEISRYIIKPDVFCRLGGDEFIIILPMKTLIETRILMEEILNHINSVTIPAGSGSWKGSLSIGISTRTSKDLDFEALMKKADNNVYEAKRAGKNCIKY